MSTYDVLNFYGSSAPTITSGLCFYGCGNMANGLKRLYKSGLNTGRLQGTVFTIAVLAAVAIPVVLTVKKTMDEEAKAMEFMMKTRDLEHETESKKSNCGNKKSIE